MSSKVIQDHFNAKIILAHSFMNWFWWKFVWIPISWRHNFFSHKCHFYGIEKFCPSDLITTLTYVLMDNFCPSFDKTFNDLNQTNVIWPFVIHSKNVLIFQNFFFKFNDEFWSLSSEFFKVLLTKTQVKILISSDGIKNQLLELVFIIFFSVKCRRTYIHNNYVI